MTDSQLTKREEDIQRLIVAGVRKVLTLFSATWEERIALSK
jgi:hypothetical protein